MIDKTYMLESQYWQLLEEIEHADRNMELAKAECNPRLAGSIHGHIEFYYDQINQICDELGYTPEAGI